MTIDGDRLHYDVSGSHPAVGSFLNSGFGTTASALYAGTKTFFPDVPLNSGFYRAVTIELGPEGTVVNAPWPIAVTGFCSGPVREDHELVLRALVEASGRSVRSPARSTSSTCSSAAATRGATTARSSCGTTGWSAAGAAAPGRDGSTATAPVFGVGLAVQPVEGQERLSPVVTSRHAIVTDSGGPGRFRGGCGVEKGGQLTECERHRRLVLLRPRAAPSRGASRAACRRARTASG